MSDFSNIDPNELDASLLDVKELADHKLCVMLGWDARILRAMIDTGFLGGRYFGSDRVYKTTERYLYMALKERTRILKNRVEEDEKLLDQ